MLGIIAWFDVIAFTIAGVIFIGALLLVAGVFQVSTPSWIASGAVSLCICWSGVLYVIGGFLLMDEPLQGSVIITILVAAALIIGGILRIVIGVQHRHMPGWGLLIVRRCDQPAGRRDAVPDAALVRPLGGRHADRRGTDRARRIVDPVRPGAAADGVERPRGDADPRIAWPSPRAGLCNATLRVCGIQCRRRRLTPPTATRSRTTPARRP